MTSIGLRPATQADSSRCYLLHRAAMRPYVEAIWGWNEHDQQAYHDRGFDPNHTRIITVDGHDAGVLIVDYRPDEIYRAGGCSPPDGATATRRGGGTGHCIRTHVLVA